MAAAEVAAPPQQQSVQGSGSRRQAGVGVVRRRHHNGGGGTTTTTTALLSPDAPPTMVVTSARSLVREEVGGGGAGRVSPVGRPRTHHGAPAAGMGRRRHHTTLAVISLDSTPVHTDEDAAEQASSGIMYPQSQYIFPQTCFTLLNL